MASSKPLVLMGATPVYGHLAPIRAVAKELISRGYDVTFITGSHYKKLIEDMGATFVPLEGYSDYTQADFDTKWPIRNTLPAGPRLVYDMEHIFVNALPSQYETQQKALKMLNDKHPGRPIVAVGELLFLGAFPVQAGARGIRPTATITLGSAPVVLSSIDTPAFGPGLPFDSSPAGLERNKAMNIQVQKEMFGQVQVIFEKHFRDLGAPSAKQPFFLDSVYHLSDRFLQLCIPSVEYPRSDAPAHIKFAGSLPKGHRDPFTDQPSWWGEVVNNKTKKIVAVSMGSLNLTYSDLIVPTLEGLEGRDDLLVVVALGQKGATLPADIPVPANARIADFIPFDDLLPHCAVFVSNGGYGGFLHAIGTATPIIIGGDTEDHPEVAARAEWAGMGYNLRTGTPAPGAVLAAVDDVISNPKYKKRALELEAEMATYDPMGIIAQTIDELGSQVK